MFAAPSFEDDEEAPVERKPMKTQAFAAPKFDDEEEGPRKPGGTQMFAAPKFDDEEEAPRKAGGTQMFAAPKFDEDEPAAPAGPRCPKCAGEMKEEDRAGVAVMVCAGCKGFYFGAKQMEELFAQLVKQQKGSDAKKTTGLLKRFFGS
jgi:hypothetical protein